MGNLPAEAYTDWVKRVLAYLIDAVPVFILVIIAVVIGLVTATCEDYGYGVRVCQTSTAGSLIQWLLYLVAIAYAVWNFGYKQGTTGSSIGKGIIKFKVVSEETGQPIGFGMSVVRQLAHAIDSAICGIGYLFPLWDAKRQTIADKIMKTVCLPI